MKRRTLKVGLVVVIAGVVAGFFLSSCLVDIRPDATFAPTEADQKKGRALLDKLVEAHGGLDKFRAARAVRVRFSDTWPGINSLGDPWPSTEMTQTILLGTDSSRLELMDGDRAGETWGIQDWATYKAEKGQEPRFVEDNHIKFWLPTVEYFLEAPFRLREATVVHYLGERTPEVDAAEDEKSRVPTYDLVFLSWGTDAPQKDIDQYIAWIDRETGRLGRLEYTVRDVAGFMRGGMEYRDQRETEGLWFAHLMAVTDPGAAKDGGLHFMELKSLEVLPELDKSEVFIAPDKRGTK